MPKGKKLKDEPLHLGLKATASSLTKITGMEWYETYSKDTEADGNEGRLVSSHTFSEPWDMWEMHPEGEGTCHILGSTYAQPGFVSLCSSFGVLS